MKIATHAPGESGGEKPGNILAHAREDLRERLARTLTRAVEGWSVDWFDSSAVERDALAMVKPLPEKIAAEVVAGLARIAAGPESYE